MIKTILIIAGVIVGAPIALFVLFVVAVIINFLIQPEMNSSGMIIECRGCPGMKNGSDKWPCNECEFRPDNRWWDPELECEILKTSRRYKKVQKKRTKERSIFVVMLPAAKSGILAAVVLGIGRAIGETMAVVMVAGNQPRMPQGILKGVRTMTANIVTEMGYATGLHREALIATAVVLFIFILIINLSLSLLNRRAEHAN